MNVKEFIEELQKFPQNSKVVYWETVCEHDLQLRLYHPQHAEEENWVVIAPFRLRHAEREE